MNARLAWLVLCSCLLALPTRADSVQATFARGNKAFAGGDYETAAAEYQKLFDAGLQDPDLAFNLGSAYGSLGRYGQAIRYFERALRLAPGDDDAEKGLAAARAALAEQQAQRTGEAIVDERPPLAEALFSRLRLGTWCWLLLGTSWLASACGILLLRVRGELARLSLGITCTAATGLGLISGLALGSLTGWGRSQGKAIVIVEAAPLRAGADASADMRGELREGTLLRVLSHEGAYLHVQTGPQDGFILASQAGEI
jgi:tetratricopeptide (TPR) repeat protein